MPKLKKSPTEQMDHALQVSIISKMADLEYTIPQIYKWLGICEPTYRKRRAHPEMFTVKELRVLFDKLQFSDAQILAVFGKGYQCKATCTERR